MSQMKFSNIDHSVRNKYSYLCVCVCVLQEASFFFFFSSRIRNALCIRALEEMFTSLPMLTYATFQMSSNATTNASMESQLDCALDLMRRLPPQQVEKNLSDLIDLVPDLTEELLAAVDQPLKVFRDRTVGKDYLLCDYNRDGDSYRSPWTNTYTPPFDGLWLFIDSIRLSTSRTNVDTTDPSQA